MVEIELTEEEEIQGRMFTLFPFSLDYKHLKNMLIKKYRIEKIHSFFKNC